MSQNSIQPELIKRKQFKMRSKCHQLLRLEFSHGVASRAFSCQLTLPLTVSDLP
jgi:hypothetical protein